MNLVERLNNSVADEVQKDNIDQCILVSDMGWGGAHKGREIEEIHGSVLNIITTSWWPTALLIYGVLSLRTKRNKEGPHIGRHVVAQYQIWLGSISYMDVSLLLVIKPAIIDLLYALKICLLSR